MNWTIKHSNRKLIPREQSLTTQGQDYYKKVYQQYSNTIIGFFCRQGYSPDEAHDGLQDVYLRVIRLSQPEKLAESPKAYLLKVATNLIRDRYRQQSTVKIVSQDVLELDNIPALQPSPEQQALLQQQVDIVKQAMMELSDNQREIFLMHRVDGMTCNEITQSLKIPLRTVQRRLSDALAYCVTKLNKSSGANK